MHRNFDGQRLSMQYRVNSAALASTLSSIPPSLYPRFYEALQVSILAMLRPTDFNDVLGSARKVIVDPTTTEPARAHPDEPSG
jgi:hypothetical protein